MAVFYIKEYEDVALAPGGGIPVGIEPPIAEQVLVIGTEVKSAAFNARTRLVRLHCDAICSFLVGSAPTAATTNARMAANQTEFVGLREEHAALKVSVISNT